MVSKTLGEVHLMTIKQQKHMYCTTSSLPIRHLASQVFFFFFNGGSSLVSEGVEGGTLKPSIYQNKTTCNYLHTVHVQKAYNRAPH